jgi:hypothetical protein
MRKNLTCARDGDKTHSAWRVFHGQKLACAPAIRALTEIIVTAKEIVGRGCCRFRWGRVARRVSSSLPTRRSSSGTTSHWVDGARQFASATNVPLSPRPAGTKVETMNWASRLLSRTKRQHPRPALKADALEEASHLFRCPGSINFHNESTVESRNKDSSRSRL